MAPTFTRNFKSSSCITSISHSPGFQDRRISSFQSHRYFLVRTRCQYIGCKLLYTAFLWQIEISENCNRNRSWRNYWNKRAIAFLRPKQPLITSSHQPCKLISRWLTSTFVHRWRQGSAQGWDHILVRWVKSCITFPSFSHGLYKFSAHKAAYPDKFPINDSTRELYPSLISIEDRCKATSVHLQVYDGEILSYHTKSQWTSPLIEAPHILPVLFSFTTPAKFCFRAIASFSRFVTEMPPQLRHIQSTSTIPQVDSVSPRQSSFFSGFKVSSPRPEQTIAVQDPEAIAMLEGPQSSNETPTSRKSLKRALSSQMSRVGNVLRGQSSPTCESPTELPMSTGVVTSSPSATHESSMSLADVAGPRFQISPQMEPTGERTAGDPAVYNNIAVCISLNISF